MRSRLLRLFALASVAALSPAPKAGADTVNLVQNGGFETGDLTGWSNAPPPGDFGWFISSGIGGFSSIAPYDGSYFAATGCLGGACGLSQNLVTALRRDLPAFVRLQSGTGHGAVSGQSERAVERRGCARCQWRGGAWCGDAMDGLLGEWPGCRAGRAREPCFRRTAKLQVCRP